MRLTGNYLIQAQQAKKRFLGYDQNKLIAKFSLEADEQFLYTKMLCKPYRIDRATGDLECFREGRWQDGNSYGEVMTLLDMLCDSRDDRFLTGRWKNTQSFGMQFHQNLLEDQRDPLAERIQTDPEKFQKCCLQMGMEPIPGGDIGVAIELFDGLRMGILFWAGDEEFAPRLRFLWDENANMYIRYETMHFAIGMLKKNLTEEMNKA